MTLNGFIQTFLWFGENRILLCGGILAFFFLSLAGLVSGLDPVPEWEPGQKPISVGLGICGLLSLLGSIYLVARVEQNRGGTSWRFKLVAGIVIGVTAIIVWFMGVDLNVLSSTELVSAISDERSRVTIYIYEYSEIPDGFRKTIFKERVGIFPITREITSVPYRVEKIDQTDNDVKVQLKVLSSFKSETSNLQGMFRYSFTNGTYHLSLPP